MVPAITDRVLQNKTTGASAAVCPFCGKTFENKRPNCTSCGSIPLVSIDDQTVYETILPMCGPEFHVNEFHLETHDDSSTVQTDSTAKSVRPAIPMMFDRLGRSLLNYAKAAVATLRPGQRTHVN